MTYLYFSFPTFSPNSFVIRLLQLKQYLGIESNLVPHLGHSIVFRSSICSKFSTFVRIIVLLMNFMINDNTIEVEAIVTPNAIDLIINVGKRGVKYVSE